MRLPTMRIGYRIHRLPKLINPEKNMKPITYYSDSPAAKSFAHVYGDRLQALSPRERLYLLLSLGLSLYKEEPVYEACADLDEDGDMPEDFVLHMIDATDEADDQAIVALIQAVAMTLND
jgi:hypothetical protein